MSVKLIWSTPEAEKIILYCARVSSNNQESSDTRLLNYLINHAHWSPYEMANMCVEIITSRAISAQMLRHRSFCFQEFSQRYAANTSFITYEARRQDIKNRQNSIDDLPKETQDWWEDIQKHSNNRAFIIYEEALNKGIAKECARMILPMATETKLYINGTLRSWIHYLAVRRDPSTQLEHRIIADGIYNVFNKEFPIIGEALESIL